MNIDAIQNGIVIDHIEAGSGKKLYDLLKLDDLDCSVALLKNVTSAKYGRKDIIKIDREMDVNLDAIGFQCDCRHDQGRTDRGKEKTGSAG